MLDYRGSPAAICPTIGPGLHGRRNSGRGPDRARRAVPTAGRAVWRLPAIAALAV